MLALTPQGHHAALLASSGLCCHWATMNVSQPAMVSDIWSSICDVTNSWLVIRPLWKGGSKGWMRRRPYFQQTFSWNAECFCMKLLRLQTEWLPLESDSIIYHNTISSGLTDFDPTRRCIISPIHSEYTLWERVRVCVSANSYPQGHMFTPCSTKHHIHCSGVERCII